MNRIAATVVAAAALVMNTGAWAGYAYTNSDFVGRYSCGLSGMIKLSGGSFVHTEGTGYIQPAGDGTITASTFSLIVQTVGNCEYSLSSDDPTTYTLDSDGLGVAGATYNLSQTSGNCTDPLLGILSLACSGGHPASTCYIHTPAIGGSSGMAIVGGTCTKQLPGRRR